MTDMYAMQDPNTQFPRPPFPPQQQDGPGDIHKMDPAPTTARPPTSASVASPGAVRSSPAPTPASAARSRSRTPARVRTSRSRTCPRSRAGEEVAALVRAEGRKAVLLPGDLQQEQYNIDIVDKTVAELGGLDILVINAGAMPTVDSIDDFETATLDEVLKVNIYPLFWMTKAASPHLKPGSAIIATSSIQGFDPSPSLAEYAVSKAGIANWVRATAQQLIERGIRVNGVAPGPIWTPLQPAFVPTEKIESFGEQTPIGRAGQPVELAPAYVFLASQESSYVLGEVIAVTGGMTLT